MIEFQHHKLLFGGILCFGALVAFFIAKDELSTNTSNNELTILEKIELVTNCDQLASLKHSSVLPLVFTEQGVSMLSSVLRSEKAVQINIEIMRAFARYRGILNENEVLKKEILKLDTKINQAFKYLLEKLDALHQNENEPRKPIGYKLTKKK
ncbi:MAG: hypothetical protein PF484_01485 [Bacteroidales bacterium]|jgi:hypothetical protein|nr:hypothetical protein [Bacteroidales bacterium]